MKHLANRKNYRFFILYIMYSMYYVVMHFSSFVVFKTTCCSFKCFISPFSKQYRTIISEL